jgi:hypothetical protein
MQENRTCSVTCLGNYDLVKWEFSATWRLWKQPDFGLRRNGDGPNARYPLTEPTLPMGLDVQFCLDVQMKMRISGQISEIY